ncbi:hypothetical protein J6590_052362, partial [Homalodisca vitripennis]
MTRIVQSIWPRAVDRADIATINKAHVAKRLHISDNKICPGVFIPTGSGLVGA